MSENHSNPLPSAVRLREVLDYDPDTGEFRWRCDKGRIKAGSTAGWRSGNGYWLIRVDMQRYHAHRLAWKYINGVDPAAYIDHINGNTEDNRIANLREADAAQNVSSAAARKATKLGLPRGVYLQPESKRRNGGGFMASINNRGVRHYLGCFKTAEAASAAYQAKARELHGEYASVR